MITKNRCGLLRLLLLLLVASNNNYHAHGFTVTDPPMPIKWPIIGTLPDFLARGGVDNLQGVYEEMYEEYGDVFGTSIMGDDELVVSDPRVFDTVLRKVGDTVFILSDCIEFHCIAL